MMSSEFGFTAEKPNLDWHQFLSLITGWIYWKFHDIDGHSDLS